MTTHKESNRRGPGSVEQDARGSFEAGKRVRDEQLAALVATFEDHAAQNETIAEAAEKGGGNPQRAYGARDANRSCAKALRAVIEG